jgi:hypothetical protein
MITTPLSIPMSIVELAAGEIERRGGDQVAALHLKFNRVRKLM